MEKKEYMQLSRTAFSEYQAKLAYLKNERRLEVAQHIKEARAFGDISENAEYDAAMDEQSALEAEIAQLEELLRHVEVLDESAIDLSSVSVGTRIALKDLETGAEEFYDIVSTTESDPFKKQYLVKCDGSPANEALGYHKNDEVVFIQYPKLSNDSPVGRAILGKKAGTAVEVVAPAGILKYEILSIEKTPESPKGSYTKEQIIG